MFILSNIFFNILTDLCKLCNNFHKFLAKFRRISTFLYMQNFKMKLKFFDIFYRENELQILKNFCILLDKSVFKILMLKFDILNHSKTFNLKLYKELTKFLIFFKGYTQKIDYLIQDKNCFFRDKNHSSQNKNIFFLWKAEVLIATRRKFLSARRLIFWRKEILRKQQKNLYFLRFV